MTPRQKLVVARKLWADLVAVAPTPQTEAALNQTRHHITTKLRTAFPDKKGYGNQYPWNDRKFDQFISGANT